MGDWKEKHEKFKTVYKWFWLWQDDKYEKWLNKMSLSGWHLVGVDYYPGIRFHFAKGEPKNYIYKLDFKVVRGMEMEDYLEIYTNAGWEYVARDVTWNYFRKEYSEGEVNELYTDNNSQVLRYKKIVAFLIGLLIFESAIFFYELIAAVWLYREHNFAYKAPAVFTVIIFCVILMMIYGIQKIRRKMQEFKNPIE